MMHVSKLGKYAILLISALCLAVMLPNVYWLIFAKPSIRPFIQYSCTCNDFLFRTKHHDANTYTNTKGTQLSKDEYQQALPLLYYRTLYSNGTMPDSIGDAKMDPHGINMANFTFRMDNRLFDIPEYNLYPIFEANQGLDKPEMLPYYFSYGKDRLKIYDSANNKIDQALSEKYTQALIDKHFQFPPKLVSYNALITKNIEYGHYLLDAYNHLYNLKWFNGQPKVSIIRIPRGVTIKYIKPVEVRSGEFNNLIVSTDNKLYLLLCTGWEMQELPIQQYNPNSDKLLFFGDLFHKNIVVQSKYLTQAIAIDRDYQLLDYYKKSWPTIEEIPAGIVAGIIFPFELSIPVQKTSMTHVLLRSPRWPFILLNLVLLLGFTYYRKTSRRRKKQAKIEFALDALCILGLGIFAVPALLLLPEIE